MSPDPIRFASPVTLVGGGARDAGMLAEARRIAPAIAAADGAADWLLAEGVVPDAVIGDMDSIRYPEALPPQVTRLCLPEQESTDFEKCLYATEAPAYIGVGFTGARVDHMMAVFNAMLRHPAKTVLLIGEREVIAAVPPARRIEVEVPLHSTVSFVPLLPIQGICSEGLAWPIEGLAMAPDGQTGTSNRADAGRIAFGFDRAGALVLLDRAALGSLHDALTKGFARAEHP